MQRSVLAVMACHVTCSRHADGGNKMFCSEQLASCYCWFKIRVSTLRGIHIYFINMMTSSNGNIFRVTGHLCGEFTGPGEFPTQRPVTWSFDVYFDLRPNKRLSKQSWGWWFETLSSPLWRHRNENLSKSNVWLGGVWVGRLHELKKVIFRVSHTMFARKVWYVCKTNFLLSMKLMGLL